MARLGIALPLDDRIRTLNVPYRHRSVDESYHDIRDHLNPKIQRNSHLHPPSDSSQATLHDEIKVLSHGGWWSGLLRWPGGDYTLLALFKQLYQKKGRKGLLEALGTCGMDRYVCHYDNKVSFFISNGAFVAAKHIALCFFDSLITTAFLFSLLWECWAVQVGCWVIKILDHFAAVKQLSSFASQISATEQDDIEPDSFELLEAWLL